jgi:hypothetical protein
VSRKDDYPPPRVFRDPVQSGPNEGATLTLTGYERLLDTYYRLRGWAVDTGIPERATLAALDMRDVADGLTALVSPGSSPPPSCGRVGPPRRAPRGAP